MWNEEFHGHLERINKNKQSMEIHSSFLISENRKRKYIQTERFE